ncbi:MAG: hypothetical protein ACM3ZE_19630, partial [Myxococcales bacterium]
TFTPSPHSPYNLCQPRAVGMTHPPGNVFTQKSSTLVVLLMVCASQRRRAASRRKAEKSPQILARKSRSRFAGGSDEQRKWHRKSGRSEDLGNGTDKVIGALIEVHRHLGPMNRENGTGRWGWWPQFRRGQ